METFKAMVPPEAGREIIRWEEDGKSIVYYGWESELLAVMAISDRLKPTYILCKVEAGIFTKTIAGAVLHFLTV